MHMDLEDRMRFRAHHVVGVVTVDRAPERLDYDAFVDHDLLDLRHHFRAPCGIRNGPRIRQKAVELFIGKARLVPRGAAGIGQRQVLDTQGAVAPIG